MEIEESNCLITSKCLREITIGDTAPTFEAEAYFQGKEIIVKKEDFRGKWLILFFYSSDFTFV